MLNTCVEVVIDASLYSSHVWRIRFLGWNSILEYDGLSILCSAYLFYLRAFSSDITRIRIIDAYVLSNEQHRYFGHQGFLHVWSYIIIRNKSIGTCNEAT